MSTTFDKHLFCQKVLNKFVDDARGLLEGLRFYLNNLQLYIFISFSFCPVANIYFQDVGGKVLEAFCLGALTLLRWLSRLMLVRLHSIKV